MRKTKLVAVLAIVSSICITGALLNNKNESKSAEQTQSHNVAVETFIVGNSSIEKFKKFTGVSIAGEQEIVTPKAMSNILDINVKEGDYVKKGQVIMNLDSSSIDKQITELDNINNKITDGVNQSKAQLDKVKEELDSANLRKSELETQNTTLTKENEDIDLKIKELSDKLTNSEIEKPEHDKQLIELNKKKSTNTALITKNNVEIKTLDVTIVTLGKTIGELENVLNSASSNNQVSDMLNGLKDKKGDYNVVAGINGVVKEVNLKEGQIPISLMKPGILIENDSTLDIEFLVEKNNLKLFEGKKELKIIIENSTGEHEVKGLLESIASEPDERTSQYKVRVTLDNSKKLFKVGDFAKVLIPTEIKTDVISIPKDALIREDEKIFVYTSNNENIIEIKEIKTGIENHNSVEVLSGLNANDKIVIKGKEFIEEGDKVNIVKEVKHNENN